jgi:uncharacterized SAM-binding protein YcdF (DUF218 family)
VTYLEPALPLLLLLGFVDLIRAWRHSDKTSRPWLATVTVAGIWFLSINAGAWALSRPLEIWYHKGPTPYESADAIVVLAGAVNPPSAGRPYALPAEDTYRRVRHAAWLFRHWRALPILVSGGDLSADTMRHLLESEGVPRPMIWIESRSMNTHENAAYSAEILRAHGAVRVVLVVEASSMPRASRSFWKAGIMVVPSPVRFTQLSWEWSDWLPGWPAIKSNGETLHELGGLLWYKLRGWI